MVSQSIAVVMAIVGISLSLRLGFSISSDSCEKAESGNSLEILGLRERNTLTILLGMNDWYDCGVTVCWILTTDFILDCSLQARGVS